MTEPKKFSEQCTKRRGEDLLPDDERIKDSTDRGKRRRRKREREEAAPREKKDVRR